MKKIIFSIVIWSVSIYGISNQDLINLSEKVGLSLSPDIKLSSFLDSRPQHHLTQTVSIEVSPLQQFVRECYNNDIAVFRQVNSNEYIAVPRNASFKMEWEKSCDEIQKIVKHSVRTANSISLKLKGSTLHLTPARNITLDRCWYIAKFDAPPSPERFEIGEYTGNGTWLVKPKNNFSSEKIISAAEFTSGNKIDPKLYSYDSYQIGDSPELRTVSIYILNSKKIPKLKSDIIRLNGEILNEVSSINCIIALVPVKSIAKLADNENVKWIEKAGPPLSASNDGSREDVGANIMQHPPYNYSGSNVNVLVYDSGIADNHVDFASRMTLLESEAVRYHSTHVSGTILGDGTASDGKYRGMAPKAHLISAGYEQNGNTLFYNNPSDIEANYYSAINNYGADLANNSIGMNVQMNCYPESYYGDYEISCILIDNIATGVLGKAFLSIWAAGNERVYSIPDYGNISPPQCAKNSLVVGSVYSDNNAITYSSSFGPLDDGRLKPDLCAPGDQTGYGSGICSTVGTNNYMNMSGTSMAAPVVSGCAALLTECWKDYHSGANPAPAVVKSILINTALDLGTPGPGYDTGYGLIQIVPAINAIKNDYIFESEIANKASIKFALFVPDSNEYVRVTLVWSDPPASPLADSALVNNIGVKLIDPLGGVHYPWTLDPDNPEKPATNNVPDSINNVEQVFAENVTGGVWKIVVAGHVFAGETQPFALCANGIIRDVSSAGMIKLDRRAYIVPSDVHVEVKDLDLTNKTYISVSAVSDTDNEGKEFILTQSSPGIFTGVISLTTNIPSDSTFLSVSHDDIISVTYHDADNGVGGINIDKTATASIDIIPPDIFNITIARTSDSTAIIKWETDKPTLGSLILTSPAVEYYEKDYEYSHQTSHELTVTNLLPGTKYKFFIVAADHYGLITTNDNFGDFFTFRTRFFESSFSDNVENDFSNWENTSGWHRSHLRALSDNFSWYCGNESSHEYSNNHNAILETPSITINTPNAALRFKEYIETEAGYDFCFVKISTDNGNSWTDLRPKVSGSYPERDISICLSKYVPGTIKVRFAFDSDSLIPREGWFIDDIRIGGFTYSNLVIDSVVTVDPMPMGNNDGFSDPGEAINLQVILLNDTSKPLPDINSILTSDSPYVEITQNESTYESVDANSYTTNSSLFSFTIDPKTPNHASLPFMLTCSNCQGETWSNSFNIFVNTNEIPECSILFSLIAVIFLTYRKII